MCRLVLRKRNARAAEDRGEEGRSEKRWGRESGVGNACGEGAGQADLLKHSQGVIEHVRDVASVAMEVDDRWDIARVFPFD